MMDWRNRRIVITAGPTREKLDPVRFLSNESSGRMGWALATAARNAGAHVTLVAGPTHLTNPPGIKVVSVTSAREMLSAARRAARNAHAVIGAAAVADWRPAFFSKSKLKKGDPPPAVRLVPNPDIMGTLAKERRGPFPRLAGFALETRHILANAKEKMFKKNLDLIVANSPRALGSAKTRAWILRPGHGIEKFHGHKTILARKILARLLETVNAYDR